MGRRPGGGGGGFLVGHATGPPRAALGPRLGLLGGGRVGTPMAPRRAVYGLWLGLRGGGAAEGGDGHARQHARTRTTHGGPGPKATTTKGETKRRPEESSGECECAYAIYKLEGEREKGGIEVRGEDGKACSKKGARGLYKAKTSQAQGRERERKGEVQAKKEKQRKGSQAK